MDKFKEYDFVGAIMAYEDGSLDIDPHLERDQALSHLVALPACKGVILFADSDRRPVQLLIAANIRRTGRARLYTEEIEVHSKRPEITSIVRHIFYVCCYNDFKAALIHYTIAKIVWPKIRIKKDWM